MFKTTILFYAQPQQTNDLNIQAISQFVSFVNILQSFSNVDDFVDYFYSVKMEYPSREGIIGFAPSFPAHEISSMNIYDCMSCLTNMTNYEHIADFEKERHVQQINGHMVNCTNVFFFEYCTQITSDMSPCVKIFKKIIDEYFNSMIGIVYSTENTDINEFYTNEECHKSRLIIQGLFFSDDIYEFKVIESGFKLQTTYILIHTKKNPEIIGFLHVPLSKSEFYMPITFKSVSNKLFNKDIIENSIIAITDSAFQTSDKLIKIIDSGLKGKYELLHPMEITENENGEPIITSAYKDNYCHLNSYQYMQIEDTE